MRIKIKTQAYFDRGTLSVSPTNYQKLLTCLAEDLKITVENKRTGETVVANNKLVSTNLRPQFDDNNKLYCWTSRFK